MIKEDLEAIRKKAAERIASAEGTDSLNDIRVALLGKKGELTGILKGMKDVSPEDRPAVGKLVNETREEIEKHLAEAKAEFEKKEMAVRLSHETIDVTLPADRNRIGHPHPNTLALQETSPEHVRSMVRYVRGQGIDVVAPACGLPTVTPLPVIQAMVEAAKEPMA